MLLPQDKIFAVHTKQFVFQTKKHGRSFISFSYEIKLNYLIYFESKRIYESEI